MTKESWKGMKEREKIYIRQACGGDEKRIQTTGCCGTACWYWCGELCIKWEENHKKQWGMHDDYNKYHPYKRSNK